MASVSSDDGETWSETQLTNIPDARTKQCAGNLPNGSSYMVCCPVNGRQRWPLVLLLSRDGIKFDHAILLRSGKADDLPPRRYEGRYKTLGLSYPKAIVYNHHLYICYSTNKEDVECTIFPFWFLIHGELPSALPPLIRKWFQNVSFLHVSLAMKHICKHLQHIIAIFREIIYTFAPLKI